MSRIRKSIKTPWWKLAARRWLGTIIALLALATFITGAIGFLQQYSATLQQQSEATAGPGEAPDADSSGTPAADWTIPFYKTFQLFLLDSGAEDDSRHPGNLSLMLARILAGILFLTVSWTVVARVIDSVRLLPRLTQSQHIIICGLGKIGQQLVEDLHAADRGRQIIVIDNSNDPARLNFARNRGAVVLQGDATHEDLLREARIENAAELFVVTGDDGTNLEVAAEANKLLSSTDDYEKLLKLFVHIGDVRLAGTLRSWCNDLHDSGRIAVSIFNAAQAAATQLIVRQLRPFTPMSKNEVAHFVIVGFGPVAQTIALQLAMLGHFRNRKRSRLTIADRQIEGLAKDFLHRYPRFTSWTDEQPGVTSFQSEFDHWEHNSLPLPDDIKIDSPDAVQYVCNARFVDLPTGRVDERFAATLAKDLVEPEVKPVILVCGERDQENFETVVKLQDQLKCQGLDDVPAFVWLPRQPALAEMLIRRHEKFSQTEPPNAEPRSAPVILPFGESAVAASYREITNPLREAVGKIIHEAYETEEVSRGRKTPFVPWAAAGDEFQESSRVAADHMQIKLAEVKVRILRSEDASGESFSPVDVSSNPQGNRRLAQMEHNRFVAERLLTGWRWTQPGDSEEAIAASKQRKLNHTLVPWAQLGEEQKKDFDQVKTVLESLPGIEGFCAEWIRK